MELTVEQFDDLLKYQGHKKILVRDEDGKVVRSCELIFFNHYYDWDKNRDPYNRCRCRWNGEDRIWDWQEDMLKEGGFTYLHGDTMVIYSKTLTLRGSIKYNYKIEIKDGEIKVGNTHLISQGALPISKYYDIDIIEKSIQKCIDKVAKMDISPKIKQVIKNTIQDAVYILSEDWTGYKPIKPKLEWKF